MATFELCRNLGTLFRNREKGNNLKAPDLKGDGLIEIGGHLYELDLAAWTKQTERAGKFLSLSIKVKKHRDAAQARANAYTNSGIRLMTLTRNVLRSLTTKRFHSDVPEPLTAAPQSGYVGKGLMSSTAKHTILY
jgi:hypothetical protein